MKIHYHKQGWEYWYDRSYRVWFAGQFDSDGHQISETLDSYDKDGILFLINRELED